MSHRHTLVAGALCALALDAAASCGAAFCVVNTDWATQGSVGEPGARLDLRYEHIDLDQPRHGRDRVSVGQVSAHHDEVETRNRNWVATLDWSFAPAWAVSVALPYVDRDHHHIHNHRGQQLHDHWSLRGLGDARVVGRYAFMAAGSAESPRAAGISFGVKLPTGEYDQANGEGALAERTLQPGTGTTDAIVGAWWHGSAPLQGWAWFSRVEAQLPMNAKDAFKPGRQFQLDAGVRRAIGNQAAVMLQANLLVKARDAGAGAEPADSGQRALFVSPGISWSVTRHVQLYAFVQVPAYQKVNGVQLTADWSALAGVSSRF